MANKLEMRICSVDVIGDSHLARLFKAGMKLSVEADLALWCRGGVGSDYLEKVIDDIEWDTLSRNPQISDLVVVFIGGNDLDTPDLDVVGLASRYITLYSRMASLGSQVIVLAQWSRPGARVGGVTFQTNALLFDHLLCQQARDFVFWRWDKGLRAHSQFFQDDGVHCHPWAYKRVMRHFSSAVFQGVRNLSFGRTR